MIIGIQGGLGSFNDEAISRYLANHPDLDATVQYLDTTPRVLDALSKGEIDLGQFALYNTVGGFYEESLGPVGAHLFVTVEHYLLPIAFALMHHPETRFDDVRRILTHPQVYKQCGRTLAERFPQLEWDVSEGDLADPASVAEAIGAERLASDTATVSNVRLASMHGLHVAASGLQDEPHAASAFLLVRRPG